MSPPDLPRPADTDPQRRLQTQCCIAGGGPAGLVLGYLLARGGVRVTVLEKHDDFLRDFRGDTIHPSTLTVLQDLGLLEEFLALPHQEVTELTGEVYGSPSPWPTSAACRARGRSSCWCRNGTSSTSSRRGPGGCPISTCAWARMRRA